jgi:hypothetical protein
MAHLTVFDASDYATTREATKAAIEYGKEEQYGTDRPVNVYVNLKNGGHYQYTFTDKGYSRQHGIGHIIP